MLNCNASLKDTTFNASDAEQDGGAIRAMCDMCDTCNMSLESCSLLKNSATSNGGAMVLKGVSAVSLRSCTLSENIALRKGGAMHIQRSRTTLTRCTISKSVSEMKGGAIYVTDHGTLMMRLSTLCFNRADNRGGAIYLSLESVATLSETHITDNTAGNDGGGGLMIDVSASASLTSCLLARNSALKHGAPGSEGRGGAVLSYSRVTIKACLISGNMAVTSGGAVAHSPKERHSDSVGPQIAGAVSIGLQISGSCLVGNSAVEEGSAVWLQAAPNQLAMTSVLEQSAVGPQNSSVSWVYAERGVVILDRVVLSSQPAALIACLNVSAADSAGVPVGLHLEKSQALLYNSTIDDKLRTTFDAFSFIVDATVAPGQQARRRISKSELCDHIEQSMYMIYEYLRFFLSAALLRIWEMRSKGGRGKDWLPHGMLVLRRISPSNI